MTDPEAVVAWLSDRTTPRAALVAAVVLLALTLWLASL